MSQDTRQGWIRSRLRGSSGAAPETEGGGGNREMQTKNTMPPLQFFLFVGLMMFGDVHDI